MTTVRPRAASRRSARRRGYGLVEGLLSLAIMAGVIVFVNHWIQQGIQEQNARGAASRMVMLTKAADSYVKANDGTIRAAFALNPAQTIVIPLSSARGLAPKFQTPSGLSLLNFKAANVLGSSFQDYDVNGQTAALIVYKPGGAAAADYEAVLAGYSPNGKPALDDQILVRAEGMSESRVGAYLQNDPTKDADGAAGPFLRGPRGGWRIPKADLAASGVSITPGHLFSYVTMEKRGQTDDSRYLVRTPDANHDNNTMTTNLDMHGYTVYNVYSLCGTTGAEVQVDPDPAKDCSAATQIKVGGDLVSNAGFYGAGRVASDTDMVAPTYYQGTTAGPNLNYYLKPAGSSVLNDVKAKWFDIDALAYSSQGDRSSLPAAAGGNGVAGTTSTVRLSDLFPKEVVKGSYVGYDGSVIAKPDCHDGLGTGSAKLFASFTKLYNEAAPQTTVTTKIDYRPVQVVTSYSASDDGKGNISVSVSTDTVNSFQNITSQSTVDPSRMYDSITAKDNGSSWTLSMPSITSVPVSSDSTQTGVATSFQNANGGDNQNQALIQAVCFYN